jgi:hypothetical protein
LGMETWIWFRIWRLICWSIWNNQK